MGDPVKVLNDYASALVDQGRLFIHVDNSTPGKPRHEYEVLQTPT